MEKTEDGLCTECEAELCVCDQAKNIYGQRRRLFAKTRMIYQAVAVGGTIIAYDEDVKKQILFLAKFLGVENLKVVTKYETQDGVTMQSIIIDDQ